MAVTVTMAVAVTVAAGHRFPDSGSTPALSRSHDCQHLAAQPLWSARVKREAPLCPWRKHPNRVGTHNGSGAPGPRDSVLECEWLDTAL
jgi:hypothetical protein